LRINIYKEITKNNTLLLEADKESLLSANKILSFDEGALSLFLTPVSIILLMNEKENKNNSILPKIVLIGNILLQMSAFSDWWYCF
jgi:hypothetical protein